MTSASDPFQTCLVGIPSTKDEWNKLYNQTGTRDCTAPAKHRSSRACLGSRQSDAGQSVGWHLGNANGGMRKISNFSALSLRPRELDVLGSRKAPVFFYPNYANDPNTGNTGVDGSGTGIYRDASAWCNLTTPSQVTTGTNAISLPDS